MDHIVGTDTRPKGFLKDAERSFTATARYLHIPIKNQAPKRAVTLLVDGKPVATKVLTARTLNNRRMVLPSLRASGHSTGYEAVGGRKACRVIDVVD